jgi:hypothetical protein
MIKGGDPVDITESQVSEATRNRLKFSWGSTHQVNKHFTDEKNT